MNKKRLKRTDINITEEEYFFIIKEVEEKGLSMSEVIRRALDKYIDDRKLINITDDRKLINITLSDNNQITSQTKEAQNV